MALAEEQTYLTTTISDVDIRLLKPYLNLVDHLESLDLFCMEWKEADDNQFRCPAQHLSP